MSSKRCKACDKKTFRSLKMAYRAALYSSRSHGKPFRVIRCPIDGSKLHLTSH